MEVYITISIKFIASLSLLVGTTVRTMTKRIGQYIFIYLFSMWDRSASPAYSEGPNEILRLTPTDAVSQWSLTDHADCYPKKYEI